MLFYLGTHEPAWLKRTAVPLFVSRRRLARRKSQPRAIGRWALDSGGFTELLMYGGWRTEPARYADEVCRWRDEIGGLDFAATQDWMCEPFMLEKTGKTVREHQELTIASYLELRGLAPEAPWCPVLQGYAIDEYLDHAEQYRAAGVDLASLPRVGVGSVCRRQGTFEAVELFAALRQLGAKLHGFGLKGGFVARCFGLGLASSDSLAWSLQARKRGAPLEGCTHKSCANCMRYAVAWRERAISFTRHGSQLLLPL
jgi:hypothetical protein